MKYLKRYDNTPKKGHWVISQPFDDNTSPGFDFRNDIIKNMIGKVTGFYFPWKENKKYLVHYDEIPVELQDYIGNSITVREKDIIHFSPKKSDLEAIIQGSKFGI